MSIDDVIRQMQDDEDSDRIETQTKATPIEYARSRGIVPQKVYYHIRNGHIKPEDCVCGRKVIDIAVADAYLGFNKTENTPNEEGEDDNQDEPDEFADPDAA